MNNEQSSLKKAIELVEKKKKTYGKSVDTTVTNVLTTLYPSGISTEEFDDAIFIIRICEKLGRITSKNIDSKAKADAYGDIVGYGLLGLSRDQRKKDEDLPTEAEALQGKGGPIVGE